MKWPGSWMPPTSSTSSSLSSVRPLINSASSTRQVSSRKRRTSSCCCLYRRSRLCVVWIGISCVILTLSSLTLLLHQWSLQALQTVATDKQQHQQQDIMLHSEKLQKRRHHHHQQLSSIRTNHKRFTTTVAPTTRTKDLNENIASSPHSFIFHRWKDSTGIQIEPLWQYMQELVLAETTTATAAPTNRTVSTSNSQKDDREYDRLNGPIPAWIDFSKQPYSLRVAIQVYRRRGRFNLQERFQILAPFFQQALKQLEHNENSEADWADWNQTQHNTTSFVYLKRIIQQGGGLPVIFLADDFTGCLYHNYLYHNYSTTKVKESTSPTKASIPFLTLSAAPDCDYAFPIPSYSVLQLAKPTPEDWDDEFRTMDQRYPWKRKQHQAVWRGALSGTAKWNGSATDVPRLHLMILAKKYSKILNVTLACSSAKCFVKRKWQSLVQWGPYIPLDDFQGFRAVVDIDGNSWSERFPKLLCRNSVVIKVQPGQVDYFWPTLQAGVHYVATNLTMLVETVYDALSPKRDEDMMRIVANARNWCRRRMVVPQIQSDFLTILNGYAEQLYRGNLDWFRHITRQDVEWMKYRHPGQWRKGPKRKEPTFHIQHRDKKGTIVSQGLTRAGQKYNHIDDRTSQGTL